MKDHDVLIVCMIGAAAGMVTLALGQWLGQTQFERVAVKHGVAHYDATTSAFTWNNEPTPPVEKK